ncbi:restriction endonuclease subunit S [Methanococcoides burtonii]|uniref:restriction endonuclease subunit S n=1 Tax=Methanococcoides burtonii TaxID=29291 RepID=UPI001E5197D3|nr:restriction endonuclease subunit S [Methanococcoides burtonii]
MGEKLGDDWVKGVLSDFGQVVSGGTPKTKVPEYWGEDILWITPADLSGYSEKYIYKGRKSITHLGLKNSSARLIPKGSVLFSSRAPIGYIAIAGNELCTNQGFKTLIPSEALNRDFLYYYLKSIKQLAEGRASGTTFKELSGKAFAELPLCVPPLPEQRAIVSKIEQLFSELDNGIANLKLAQQQLKVYRQSVLKKAFEGELTRQWREQQTDLPDAKALLEQIQVEREESYNEKLDEWKRAVKEWEDAGKEGKKPTKPKKLKKIEPFTETELAELPTLPNGYGWTRLGELHHLKSDKHTGSGESLFYIGLEHISKNQGTLTDEVKIDVINTVKNSFKKGDLLYGKLRPYLNKVYLANEDGVCSTDILVFESIPSLDLNYSKYYFLSYKFVNDMTHNSSGVNLPRVSTKYLQEYPFPLFSLEEQQAIVTEIETRLSVCDKVEQDIEDNLKIAEALRQSILKKAFEGKLLNERELEEVRSAPDWEPAEVLLEKIRAEKAGSGKKGKA